MNALHSLGKYLFALPFAVFGVLHLMNASTMASGAFGQVWLVYLTGVCLIAATASMLLGRYDKLATTLLGLMLLIFVFAVHLKPATGGDPNAVGQILKDTMLAGGAWIYAKYVATDNSVIG
ncbi:MAG: DoxX family protein [Saprospiraceae bacterium]|nr:DoxX family protein [Saprospiraceae bacterium]